jgi:hypothetical protein
MPARSRLAGGSQAVARRTTPRERLTTDSSGTHQLEVEATLALVALAAAWGTVFTTLLLTRALEATRTPCMLEVEKAMCG